MKNSLEGKLTQFTHKELPDVPEGHFWRIYIDSNAYYSNVVVELRRRTPDRLFTKSVLVESECFEYWPKSYNARMDAIHSTISILNKVERSLRNTLGDLEGDHPPD